MPSWSEKVAEEMEKEDMESGMPHDIKRMSVEDLHKLNEKHSEATTLAAVNADKKNGQVKG